jgi:ankyrin repeat protein
MSEYLKMYLPLYQAGLRGDWQATKVILDKYPGAIRAHISEDNQNILHIATLAKRSAYVEKLLQLMNPEDLEMKDTDGNTALYYAALSGIVKIAEEMVKINNKLPFIHGKGEVLPLHMASTLRNREMVLYLLSVTHFEELTASDRIDFLSQTISSDLYGMYY